MKRLESLKADEDERRTTIGALEQRKYGLDGEIRLDLVAYGQREQAAETRRHRRLRLRSFRMRR